MLANDLLQQARLLATLDARKPKQANLRRAISAAYYALFHLLVAAAVERVSPRTPGNLAPRIARAFSHLDMKQVCKSLWAGNPSEILRELQPAGFSAEIRLVARLFVELQEARHLADYDPAVIFDRDDTIETVWRVENAFQEWQRVKMHDEATVFLTALLFAGRWSK